MRSWSLLLLLAGCPVPLDTDSDGDTDTTIDPGCDLDEDGEASVDCGGADCDDQDAQVRPGAPERCNGVDDDCDGETRWEDEDCTACDEAGFFSGLVGAEDPAGRADALRAVVGEVDCDYRDATLRMFTVVDKIDGEVEGVYTGIRVPVGSDKPDGDVMNTEHTWPRSEGADRDPARCDLHHLFPTDSDANQARANLPLGEVSGRVQWSVGGSAHDGDVFEPRDVHKGDAARAMLYFELTYPPTLPAGERDVLLRWHADDPPSQREIERSWTIARWQDTPNPFVVCPFAVGETRTD